VRKQLVHQRFRDQDSQANFSDLPSVQVYPLLPASELMPEPDQLRQRDDIPMEEA
jgi:hypothetical protein